jgi:hypothetical protein
MLSQQLDLLDGFIQISDQGTSQLHLISEESHAAVISSRQYHSFMSQDSQRFSGCLSHACLERPPRCRSLDHFVDVADMIGHKALIDHHTYTLKVRVSMKQPQGSDEEWGLARSTVRIVLRK